MSAEALALHCTPLQRHCQLDALTMGMLVSGLIGIDRLSGMPLQVATR